MATSLDSFREIWLCDFEFFSRPGERPDPVCMVAMEARTGRKIRLWSNEFGPQPPFPIRPDILFVAYFASAELGCFLSLKWEQPARVLDLFTEFRNLLNGTGRVFKYGLMSALTYYGIDSIGVVKKDHMRDFILRGGPWSWEEREAILDYCESDVVALARLLPVMGPQLDTPRAIYRGRYMAASARMEFVGTPINLELLERIRERWSDIQDQLIASVDTNYGVYEGRTFKANRFRDWTIQQQIDWPTLPTGHLDLDSDTFRDMSKLYPVVSSLRELRHNLSKLRLDKLEVGPGGFNRCILSPFASKTGRNQPSNNKYIFGPSVWMRFLIQPPPGFGLCYIDWSQQEVGIGAALSRDPAMLEGYASGDAYLAFGKAAGGIPQDATPESHEVEREPYKQCVLGVQYSMWERALAKRIGQPVFMARQLLNAHHQLYRVFWTWSDNNVDRACLFNTQSTVFGWHNHVPSRQAFKDRSHRNFHMQAHGAEMLRLACILATEHGILVVAPVHDAVMIMAPLSRLEADIASMREIMAYASRVVLGGVLTLRTKAKEVRPPDHFYDKRGAEMWEKVMELL